MPKKSARWIAVLAIILGTAILDLGGTLAPLDWALMDLRFRFLDRPASGNLVVVQIDSRSLRELDVWPWPRRYHAELIDRLMAAGVREIAWDVDLSARSTEEDDRAFVDALARADNRVILPAFRQAASPEATGDKVYDTLPISLFREHAQVGGVNISPAPDGLIRKVSDVQTVGAERLPSLFALLVGPSAIQGRSFFIDYGIDPNTIPRISYVDVLRGTAGAERLSGKSVIVGATAAQLGDILPVPVYRSMAGAVLQAMAYESQVQGRAIRSLGPGVSVPVGGLLVLLFAYYGASRSWRRALAAGALAMIGLEVAAIGVQAAAPVALTTAPWLMAIALSLMVAVSGRVETQAREILAQRAAIATRRALMDRMVENSFDGIIIADQDGIVQLINMAAEGILSCPADETIGQPLDLVLLGASDLTTRIGPVWDADDPGAERTPREWTLVLRDGKRIDIELIVGMVSLAPGGRKRSDAGAERTYHTFTFRDISERKRVQNAERRATEEALAANRAKTEFLANMSHELRTPLNAIIGFADMIRSEVLGPISPPGYLEYVGDISASGTHLLAIINDILDVSRIELGQYKINKEPVNPHEILDSCIKIAGGWPSFSERQFEAELPDDLPTIEADGRLIKQSVVNLLSNAFNYSRSGDRIVLSAGVDDYGWLVVSVRDTGIGIAADHLPNLTKAFYQVDGTLARQVDGTGLGMFLTASFIRLHGGDISIQSEPDIGTTVTLRVPSTLAEVATHSPAAAIAARG